MGHKHPSDKSRAYHNRVAAVYDNIYDDPFWDFHDQLTWDHLKTFVPESSDAAVLDLGCGTGKWGLKLLKAGFPTSFVDHSPKMLEMVERKLKTWAETADLSSKAGRATLQVDDAKMLQSLPPNHFSLAIALGDVVSICGDASACLSALHRVMKTDGVLVFTVDNLLAGLDHFVSAGKLDDLDEFVRSGKTHWLTADEREQFALRMFTPQQIEHLAGKSGFAMISIIGKTILPVRQNRKFFQTNGAIKQMLAMEALLARDPVAAGRAAHLQLAVRKRA
jgi:ubiquinone/menaquinone biosynthesis C-methylase UbiE